MPAKYRKKPVTIEAMQWDGSASGATPVIDWVLTNGGTATYRCDDPYECPGTAGRHYLMIHTLEGPLAGSAGDWIIRGVQGEFYPCKPDVFAATYDYVDEEAAAEKPTLDAQALYKVGARLCGAAARDLMAHSVGNLTTDEVHEVLNGLRNAVSDWREFVEPHRDQLEK